MRDYLSFTFQARYPESLLGEEVMASLSSEPDELSDSCLLIFPVQVSEQPVGLEHGLLTVSVHDEEALSLFSDEELEEAAREALAPLEIRGRESRLARANRERAGRLGAMKGGGDCGARPALSMSAAEIQPTAEELRAHLRAACQRMGLEEVYEVGGCLRDELLGREPKDIDLSVVGVEADTLLERARREGRAEELVVADRLIGVRLRTEWTGKEGVELALARTEVSTGPAHTDFEIRPDPSVSIQEDLGRRDFTVNAMARDLNTGEWADPYGGRADLEARLLRTVSEEAFRDDPLRILRGLARVSKDDLQVEAGTWTQMRTHAHRFRSPEPWDSSSWELSAERVYDEYEKSLSGREAARAFGLARDLEILQATVPEWAEGVNFDQESKYHSLTVDQHQLLALQHAARMDAPLSVRWAALLHDMGKPQSAWRGEDGRLHFYSNPKLGKDAHERIGARQTEAALRRLRAPRERIQGVGLLVTEHMYREDADFALAKPHKQQVRARRFIRRVGRENVPELLLLRRCDRAAKSPTATEAAGWDRDCRDFEAAVRRHWNDPLTTRELAVNGHDLLKLGLEGRQIGEAQRTLLDRVMLDPTHNQRERLLGWASKL